MVAVRIEQPDGDDSHDDIHGASVNSAGPDASDVPDASGAVDVSDTADVSEATDASGTGNAAESTSPRDDPATAHTAERRSLAVQVLDYRAVVDATYRAHAIGQAYEKIREIERNTVTPAMKRIEAEDQGRHLAGLEHRLKGKDRLAEKVAFDVQKKGITVDEAVANVKDSIRYTLCYPEGAYAAGVHADCDRLTAHGFELVERRNSWDKEQYKGINSRWRVPSNGQLFELQFHTKASFSAKEETHWAYEKLRVDAPTPGEQRELEDYQSRITARVPKPPGAQDISDYP